MEDLYTLAVEGVLSEDEFNEKLTEHWNNGYQAGYGDAEVDFADEYSEGYDDGYADAEDELS